MTRVSHNRVSHNRLVGNFILWDRTGRVYIEIVVVSFNAILKVRSGLYGHSLHCICQMIPKAVFVRVKMRILIGGPYVASTCYWCQFVKKDTYSFCLNNIAYLSFVEGNNHISLPFIANNFD